MKRTERHHLQQNEFVEWLRSISEWYEGNRNLALYGGIAILVVAVAVGATVLVRQNTSANASRMLAEAMSVAEARVMPPTSIEAGKPPVQIPGTYPTDKARLEAALPKLLAVADTYPSQESGWMARYRAAAALVAVGRTQEGIKQYLDVAEKSKGVYQVMAKVGIAEAYVASGQFNQAIDAFKAIAQQPGDDTPLDGVLMQLARAYRLAGKTDDARKTYRRVVEEFPQSPYTQAARRELDGQ